MDIINLYKALSEAKVAEDNIGNFVKGYLFYCSMPNDWVLLDGSVRLVYRCPGTVSMVVMPFYIPALKKQIWGVEVNGIYLSVVERESKEHYAGCLMAQTYGDSSEYWGNNELCGKRPFALPTADELDTLLDYHLSINAALEMLHKDFVQVAYFHGGPYYIKTDPNRPQEVHDANTGETFAATIGDARNVLHADNDRDVFCEVNSFGMPKGMSLDRCLQALGYEKS